jgi:hypothetical protein
MAGFRNLAHADSRCLRRGIHLAARPKFIKPPKSHAAKVLLLAAAAAFMIANSTIASQYEDMRAQGSWAYTQRDNHDGTKHIATTPAAEGDVWPLLACSADERLTVSLIHTSQFTFPLKPVSSVELRSKDVPGISVDGKIVEGNLIFLDPELMRRVMPLLVQDDQVVVSIAERDGPMHDCTFSTQPNDVALRAIRSRCFGE